MLVGEVQISNGRSLLFSLAMHIESYRTTDYTCHSYVCCRRERKRQVCFRYGSPLSALPGLVHLPVWCITPHLRSAWHTYCGSLQDVCALMLFVMFSHGSPLLLDPIDVSRPQRRATMWPHPSLQTLPSRRAILWVYYRPLAREIHAPSGATAFLVFDQPQQPSRRLVPRPARVQLLPPAAR